MALAYCHVQGEEGLPEILLFVRQKTQYFTIYARFENGVLESM
jgi:hypothetical protein